MMMGDVEGVVWLVVIELGLDEYFVQVLFDQKVVWVKELCVWGLKVVMVGDGVNDVLVLVEVDFGIVIGVGMDVVVELVDVVFVCFDLCDVEVIFGLLWVIYNKMVQNLIWVIGYNVFVILMVVGIIFGIGFMKILVIGVVWGC